MMASQARTNNSVYQPDIFTAMTRKNGVAFHSRHEIPLNNYLKSLVHKFPDVHIVSASRISNGCIAVYFEDRDDVEQAILHGFGHDNEYIDITPLVKPATPAVVV